MPGRLHESHRGLGRHSLKHLRVPSLNPHGQMGTHSRKDGVCFSSRGKDGAGLPFKAMSTSREPTKGPSSLVQPPGQPLELRIEWYWGPG